MKLMKLGDTFPEDGRLILAVYENNNSELEFEVIEYNGRLSYKSKSVIFWSYIHNQPERSKREDLGYKYCYELYDYDQESISACNTRIDVVFSKEQAQCWVDHGINRTWHEKKVCKVFPEMRCSEHCGDTVRHK